MSTITGLNSSTNLSSMTRSGLVGGVMVGNLASAQRELSHSAELAARRESILRIARRERRSHRSTHGVRGLRGLRSLRLTLRHS